jgi:hypothetical protein
MRRVLVVLLSCCFVLISRIDAPAQQSADFSGVVVDAEHHGVPNLEVKLSPPRDSKLAIRLGSTDRNGSFVFRQIARGHYLLEVSQGVYLLYRAEVDTSRQPRVTITLQRKG